MSSSTAVAKTDTLDARSKLLAAYGADEGDTGYEGVTGSDLSLPFLSVLQGISPEVADNNPEGARAGMFINSITKELIDGEKSGVVFQPVLYEKKFVEWVPRAQGGGWVGAHEPTSDVVREAQKHSAAKGLGYGKLETPSGNQLVETLYFYGHILSEDGNEVNGFAVLPCTSTKIKPAQAFLTVMMTTLKGRIKLWGWRTRVMTKKEKNDQGTFHTIEFKPFGGKNWLDGVMMPDSPLFAEGAGLRDMILSGKAKVDHSQQGAPAAGGKTDDEIPF